MSRELPGSYDPELPILAELEQALRARADETPASVRGRTGSPSYRGDRSGPRSRAVAAEPVRTTTIAPGRRRTGRRGLAVARRAALLASLSLLVGATAVATRSFVGGDGEGDPSLRATPAVELGAGAVAGERWSLSAARRGGELCHGFLADGAVATRCERPPAAGGIVVDGLASGRARYVVGLAGERVERVAVQRGELRAAAATRPLPTTTAALRARVPRTTRWFVVALPPSAGRGPVTVVAQGRGGAALGPAVVTCARGAREQSCRSR